MGCGSSKDAKGEFENGFPEFSGNYVDFKIDSCTRGFERNNGIVFRLVDNKQDMWAYYNDSKDCEAHVAVTFSAACELEALENTNLKEEPSGEWLATTVVPPLHTVMFVQGIVNGFKSRMSLFPAGRSEMLMEAQDEEAQRRGLGTPIEEAFETETEVLSSVTVLTPLSPTLSYVVIDSPRLIAA